jgi:uncharacterized membrane protein
VQNYAKQKQSIRRQMRSKRDRLILLVGILAAFVAVYLLVISLFGESMIPRLAPVLPSLLTSVIGVGITVLVTTFSFVFVALSLVSVQFSPRVVRHFWHGDAFRRVFLWAFIGIFAFCFVVQFLNAPRIQGLALTLSAYAIFVLFPAFLSYLADNLNAASITKNICDRTVTEIGREYPETDRDAELRTQANIVRSTESGFLNFIDTVKLAEAFSATRFEHPQVHLEVSNYLGSFIEVGSPLAMTEPVVDISSETAEKIRRSFRMHKFRSIEQDIGYGIRQLVDIGVKAISPAVNDPTTCVNCIHYLGVILKEMAVRQSRSSRSIELEKAGILLKEPSFKHFLDDSFDQIYHFGRRDHVVVRTIVNVLTDVLSSTNCPVRLEAIITQVEQMELGSLYGQQGEQQFALIENRNYLRKSLKIFYMTAAEKTSNDSVRDDLRRKIDLIEQSFDK